MSKRDNTDTIIEQIDTYLASQPRESLGDGYEYGNVRLDELSDALIPYQTDPARFKSKAENLEKVLELAKAAGFTPERELSSSRRNKL